MNYFTLKNTNFSLSRKFGKIINNEKITLHSKKYYIVFNLVDYVFIIYDKYFNEILRVPITQKTNKFYFNELKVKLSKKSVKVTIKDNFFVYVFNHIFSENLIFFCTD